MTESKTYVAVFAEEDFERLEEHDMDKSHAAAYCSGMTTGANQYAGTLGAYVLPDDLEEMLKLEDSEAVAAAIAEYESRSGLAV